MYNLKITKGYESKLTLRETEKAIKFLKETFEQKLSHELNLERISAPMFVVAKNGVNDDLNGVERAVSFEIKEIDGITAEIVHSLAKWKRLALKDYEFNFGEGLYTDMNAIRRDDNVDNIHSIYVDQWDWELVIHKSERTIEYLKSVVKKIVNAIADTNDLLKEKFKNKTNAEIDREVFFITTQELEDMYPELEPKQRECELIKKHKTVFLMQIGGLLKSGIPHDGRAPDYDDWKLNGDLIFYNEVLDEPLEISSMGIRVDEKSIVEQCEFSGKNDRLVYSYHRGIQNQELPLTIGGGIGQSRLCMLLLSKLHIGEVQVSLWPEEVRKECLKKGIRLL